MSDHERFLPKASPVPPEGVSGRSEGVRLSNSKTPCFCEGVKFLPKATGFLSPLKGHGRAGCSVDDDACVQRTGIGHDMAPTGTKTLRATIDSSLRNVRSFIEQEGAESAELVFWTNSATSAASCQMFGCGRRPC
jgi:hypothetical protein